MCKIATFNIEKQDKLYMHTYKQMLCKVSDLNLHFWLSILTQKINEKRENYKVLLFDRFVFFLLISN